ncbi:MAG: ATPase, T2SS/T4P/T4SS family [Candidatus Thorarchaeota archaeon]
MEENGLIVVVCHDSRCKECTYESIPRCRELAPTEKSVNHYSKAMLLEPTRNLLHLGGVEKTIPLGPPWLMEGWETIFITDYESIMKTSDGIIDAYPVGPYLSVFIMNDENNLEHAAIPRIRTKLELELLKTLVMDSGESGKNLTRFRLPITERLRQISSNIAEEISQSIPEVNHITRKTIADIAAYESVVLGPIFPILLDDEVEEVYLDRPGTRVYFDHRRFGRCESNIVITDKDVSRLVTLVRAESNFHLDYRNPSLKSNIELLDVTFRVSMSLPPLHPDGLHLEIRRPRQIPYSIADLILNKTLTVESAALLILAVSSRMNITITGGPGVGKTTLLTALEEYTPRAWRKIYIEDAVESRIREGHHQVRLQVDPVDEVNGLFNKSTEIVKSLHRSPDYVILGEIQTDDHSNALFQSIAAGLRSMQTCHSDCASSLISRWTLNHRIESPNIAMMDLIVTLERPTPGKSPRRIKEIVEIRRETKDGLLSFIGLNKIYDVQSSNKKVGGWAIDGAFQWRAKEAGVVNHLPAFDALVDALNGDTSILDANDCGSLVDRLWSAGDPMRFMSNP